MEEILDKPYWIVFCGGDQYMIGDDPTGDIRNARKQELDVLELEELTGRRCVLFVDEITSWFLETPESRRNDLELRKALKAERKDVLGYDDDEP